MSSVNGKNIPAQVLMLIISGKIRNLKYLRKFLARNDDNYDIHWFFEMELQKLSAISAIIYKRYIYTHGITPTNKKGAWELIAFIFIYC